MAVAPICGALAWRPHIWITGAAGTGKSWVMDNIMRPILGRVGLFVQGDTTEAGIRQALGYDARPVLFDEAEGESERAQARMQNVLALMRQSSSENGSVIVKGTTTGAVKVYSIRSCFAFSSIGVGIKQHSDSTRVSILALKRNDAPDAGDRFADLRRATAELLVPGWVGRLHARMISLIPVVRANSEIFATAAASAIGSQRMGDQVGALLAGAYALHSDKEISRDEAKEWIKKQDWSEQTTIQESPDEVLCLQRLMQHVMRVQAHDGRPEERNVAELIELSEHGLDPAGNSYRHALLRNGIKVGTAEIVIASNHAAIQEIMAGTPWSDWSRILRRLPGAKPTPGPTRFSGFTARGTIIPREAISN
jgi:putative DNA primase/helicase